MTNNTEREAFERWANDAHMFFMWDRSKDGAYFYAETRCAWLAWQAARATPVAAGAVPAEPVLWVESEPLTRLLPLREVIDSPCHTVMYHHQKPRTDNPVWALCECAAAPAIPAPLKPVAGDGKLPGTRDDFNLLRNARWMLPDPQSRSTQNFLLAMDLFAVGSTSAYAICRAAGIDPNGKDVTPVAAIEAERAEGAA